MKYVAFDLGASSGKLFEGVLRKGRLELTPVHSFANGIVRLGDGLYWDFMGIWREMCAGLRKAEQRGHVDALGVDSFNNDFSLIGSDGALLAPVRAYRDPRTLRHWDAIFAKISQRELYMKSGNQIAPFNTLMHLAAMGLDGQHHMLEGARHLLMLPDLIGYYVTAREGIEYTLAAETELMDLRDRTWIDALFRLYDIPKRLMPPLRLPGTVLGPSTAGFNADCGIRGLQFVNVCEHDTASAFIGSPLGERAVVISSGTWALVGVEAPAPVIDEFTFAANIANEGGPEGHHRVLRNVMGMWLIQELKRDYERAGQRFSFPEIADMAAAAAPFVFPIDPDDPEFYLPGDMRDKVRRVSLRENGCAPETPAEFFRCVYEALAMKYRWVVELLETAVGRRYEVINIIGGGCQDKLLDQFTANACAREVQAGPADASAIGNLLMQMVAMGEVADIPAGRSVVARSFPMEVFHPDDERAWTAQYARYQRCFAQGGAASTEG